MISKDAIYDMDKAQHEIADKKLLLDVKVETQVILQLLVEKGICTREEVSNTREKVKSQPHYATLYQYLDNSAEKAQYLKDNPEKHLKGLFNAKLKGDL